MVGASTLGSVMVPRGEFSFIMAKQATDSGAVRDMLYPVTMLVTLATMLCMPLLLRALPTRADKNSLIPPKVLNPIFIVGKFFHNLMNSKDEKNQFNLLLKQHGPKFFINLIIVIAILTIIDYFNDDILLILDQTGIPLIVGPDILMIIISILLIAYPIISMLGKIENLVTSISDILSTKLIPADTRQLEEKPLHRLLRNIFFTGFVLIIVAVIEPYIADIEFFPILPILISVIGLAIAVLLIADSIFVFQKLSHSHLMESLLKDEEKPDEESAPT